MPHDIPGLVELIGREEFNRRLEEGFERSERHNFAAHVFDRTMGQSAEFYINHGNEVNMCTPYLFNYSGKPWLAQRWARAILERFYGETPYHGWEGDEDEGQMSAWYVMSAMGLFEMDGGCSAEPMVDLGSPLFEKITVRLDPDYYRGGPSPSRRATTRRRMSMSNGPTSTENGSPVPAFPLPRSPKEALCSSRWGPNRRPTATRSNPRNPPRTGRTKHARGLPDVRQASSATGKGPKRAIQGRKNRTNNCIIKKDLLCLHI